MIAAAPVRGRDVGRVRAPFTDGPPAVPTIPHVPEITRRQAMGVLGVGALAAGGTVAARDVARTGNGAGPDGPARSAGPVAAENRLTGDRDWKIGADGTVPADDRGRQIKGYTSATSVSLGGSIDFHVSTHPARAYTVAVYRLGDYGGAGARLMARSPRLAGRPQPEPATDPRTGLIRCRWAPGWRLRVPRGWTSGAYLAAFTADSGHRSYAPFAVRDDQRRADLLAVLPFATYQAYNQWPLDGRLGRSLYYGYGRDPGGNAGAEATGTPQDSAGAPLAYGLRARQVSFDRPYAGVGLPQRADLDHDAVQWLEREGYDVAYATGVDLHEGRVDPSRYAGLLFTGHDEYWSRQMRDTVTAAVARGTHLAYLGANNVYWHVRFAPDGREMSCWKTDPDPDADASGPTARWREVAPHAREAEQGLLGVQYNGIPRHDTPLVVASAGHWFWRGTGVRDGEAIPGLVGGEADGLDPRAPRPRDAAEHALLSASPYVPHGGGAVQTQHSSLYRTHGGALVFVAGTFHWPLGLNRPGYADRRVQQATRNLLAEMVRRP
jgi:hypothetical protein